MGQQGLGIDYSELHRIDSPANRALRKDLWTFGGNRIAVRFQYEWRDASDQWHRSYGNELWEFASDGRMARREASINDVALATAERRFLWPAPGPRPAEHPGIVDLR